MAVSRKSIISVLLRFFLVKLPIAFVVFSLLWVLFLKFAPVVLTPLMVSRAIEYRADEDFKTKLKWRSIDRISPEMPRAVIASEDNRFMEHNGFDRIEIRKAIEDHKTKGKKLRGASTISQQTAKNVFCLPRRSYTRKAFEAYFTVLIEFVWGKERIMEVYLNVAEMGKGVYGAEAAARHHFGHGAETLSRGESCLIAASLPDPLGRNPAKPSSYLTRRSREIAALETKLVFPEWIDR